ncbi:hypothetical protein [Methylomonas rivi]|uniref:Uncharacterized protein n=1 Tax=Methylomonas rivi TaxID=2952226 RepID=A0ABT1U672_9GAMM|nr:hypothetical protein [Methylomonas sp. WSC-6]MCQ8129353.1 hypothetical protein [Methylomonas sp. WSC-6]
MMATHSATQPPFSIPDIDLSLLDRIVDKCFEKMRDDYRVNRFFNGNPPTEQTKPLKALVRKVLSGAKVSEHLDVLDDFFTAAFARSNAKPSLVTGNDFAFLLDVIGGQDIQVITPLCMCHSFLLKLGPDDDHYDILLEHLSAAMDELKIGKAMSEQLLDIAASGREGALGRLPPSS